MIVGTQFADENYVVERNLVADGLARVTVDASDDNATATALDRAGGGVLLSCTLDDNEEVSLYSNCELFKTTVAGDYLRVTFILYPTEAASGVLNLACGLADVGGATDFLQDNGAGPQGTVDGVYVFTVDGGTVWQAEQSNATTQDTDTNIADFDSETQVRFDFVLRVTTGGLQIDIYKDGAETAVKSYTDKATSSLEDMEAFVYLKSGTATTNTCEVRQIAWSGYMQDA